MSSSASFEIDFPDVGFRKIDQEFYQYLIKKESGTPFSGLDMADVFIYAMSLGFDKERSTPYGDKSERVPNMPARAFDSEMRWLMRSLAITVNEESESIVDHRKVVDIAEEYANTGIDMMKGFIDKQTIELNQDAIFESHLRERIEKIK